MKKNLILVAMVVVQSPLFAAEAFNDFKADRAVKGLKKIIQKTMGDEDPIAAFSDTYLTDYSLDATTDLAMELKSFNTQNTERNTTYQNRIKKEQTALIDTFKLFRLPAEWHIHPDIPSYIRSLKQAHFLLSGDQNITGTFAWLYAQNPGRTGEITELKAAVEGDGEAIKTYFTSTLKVEPSDAVATYAADLKQAFTACTDSSPYYNEILKPLSEQVLSGAYHPLTEPLGSMCERYSTVFGLKRSDPSSVLKKITIANAGLRNQLKNAFDIVNNKLNKSAPLQSKGYDIWETFLSSGATILQARLIALDIAGQCGSAYAILLKILTACKERMPATATGDGSQEQLIADRLHLMTISDPSVLTIAGLCQKLREITIHKTTTTRFYSDKYAFNVKTTTRNSDATIVEGTVQKFITDTQESHGLLVALMKEIPEIATADEIKNLAEKIGIFYLLYTAFNNQDDFDYNETLTKQFPGTRLASRPASSSTTPPADEVSSDEAMAAPPDKTNAEITPPSQDQKSQAFSCNGEKTVTITAANDTDLSTITAIACNLTDWADTSVTIDFKITMSGSTEKYCVATPDNATACAINLTKAQDSAPPDSTTTYTAIYQKETA